MSTGLCKDCKFWNVASDLKDDNMCICDRANAKQGEPEDPNTKAYADGVDGWSSWLKTAPDFGCIQFEARDNSK